MTLQSVSVTACDQVRMMISRSMSLVAGPIGISHQSLSITEFASFEISERIVGTSRNLLNLGYTFYTLYSGLSIRSPGKSNVQTKTPRRRKRRRLIGHQPATEDDDYGL